MKAPRTARTTRRTHSVRPNTAFGSLGRVARRPGYPWRSRKAQATLQPGGRAAVGQVAQPSARCRARRGSAVRGQLLRNPRFREWVAASEPPLDISIRLLQAAARGPAARNAAANASRIRPPFLLDSVTFELRLGGRDSRAPSEPQVGIVGCAKGGKLSLNAFAQREVFQKREPRVSWSSLRRTRSLGVPKQRDRAGCVPQARPRNALSSPQPEERLSPRVNILWYRADKRCAFARFDTREMVPLHPKIE